MTGAGHQPGPGPLRLHARVPLEAGITGVAESGRRVLHHRAARARGERVDVEVVDVGVVEIHRQERIPDDAVAQGHAIELPCVLGVGGGDRLRHAHRVGAGLPVLGDTTGEKIAHRVAGELAGERIAADRPRIGQRIGLCPQIVSAEAELMRRQCLKRKLTPDELAKFTVFLASDEASACTAQHYVVDGGWV